MFFITDKTTKQQEAIINLIKKPEKADKTKQPTFTDCLILDSNKQLYYLYPSDNSPMDPKAIGVISGYVYEAYEDGFVSDGVELDLYDDDTPFWEVAVPNPILIITKINLDEPEVFPEEELKEDHPSVHSILSLLNAFGEQSMVESMMTFINHVKTDIATAEKQIQRANNEINTIANILSEAFLN